MKKILIIFVALIFIVGCNENSDSNNSNLDSNKVQNSQNPNEGNDLNEDNENVGMYIVNLYLFHSNSCSHCKDEKTWLKSIESDYKYLKIHYYEVSEHEELYQEVRNAFNITSTGVPLTIIGDDYYLGFSASKERKFIREIKSVSESEYCDIVAHILEGKDYSSCIQ